MQETLKGIESHKGMPVREKQANASRNCENPSSESRPGKAGQDKRESGNPTRGCKPGKHVSKRERECRNPQADVRPKTHHGMEGRDMSVGAGRKRENPSIDEYKNPPRDATQVNARFEKT